MSAGSFRSNHSDGDIDPSLNSVKLANFILLYELRTVVQLFQSLLVSSVSVFFFDVGSIPAYVYLVCVDRSLFCQYCWNVDVLVDRCLSFYPFSFGHCFVRSSSIYGFWLPLWYLQTPVIGGGYQSTLWKPPTCRKSLTTKFITSCCIE